MAIERIRRISGTALPVRGDNIDTDRIIPARFLKSVSFEGLEDHLFEDDRAQAASAGVTHPVSNRAYVGATIMLVNANFGCGSSREHAPQAIRRRGIRTIVGQSFSEIFFGNSVALGLPCVNASADTLRTLMDAVERTPSTIVDVNLEAQTVTAAGETWRLTLAPAARESFLSGAWDATGLLLDDYKAVEAVAERLPYVMGWPT